MVVHDGCLIWGWGGVEVEAKPLFEDEAAERRKIKPIKSVTQKIVEQCDVMEKNKRFWIAAYERESLYILEDVVYF